MLGKHGCLDAACSINWLGNTRADVVHGHREASCIALHQGYTIGVGILRAFRILGSLAAHDI
jgi:hypothetical protein